MKNLIISSLIFFASNAMALDIIAHRGDNTLAPENSLEAAEIAWGNGLTFVEGDFYQISTGEIICIHGKNELKKLTGKEVEKIEDLSAKDLKNLNLASTIWKEKFKAVKVPTLDEFFASVPKNGVVVFEVKNYTKEYAKKIEEARKKAKLKKEQIVFIAFGASYLKDINAKLKGHKNLWLFGLNNKDGTLEPSVESAIKTCKDIGANGVNVGNSKLITKDYVDAIHSAGLQFYVWTVNDYNEFQRLVDIGVDGITTDKGGEFLKKSKEK